MTEQRSPNLHFEGATPILRVSDFDASVRYYVDALGFDLQWQDGRFGCVRRDDATLFLSEGSQGSARTWVYISISDTDEYHAEISGKGARIRVAPTNYPWGSRELHVYDPDDHVLRFGSEVDREAPLGAWLDEDGAWWQPQPGGTWARTDQEQP